MTNDREPIIDLTDQSLLSRTERVVPPEIDAQKSGRPAPLNDGFREITITGGDHWLAAEAFVYSVYRKTGYCAESTLRRVEELQPWSKDSTFHAVLDEHDSIVGTIRTIDGDFANLPIGAFERTDFSHPDPVTELSSLAVEPSKRGTGVIEHLYRAGWLHAFAAGSNSVVGLVDVWLYEVFRDYYGLPFSAIGKQRFHMGGDLVPIGMALTGSAYDDLARTNPEFWRWTLEAIEPRNIVTWDLPILATTPDEPNRIQPAATPNPNRT